MNNNNIKTISLLSLPQLLLLDHSSTECPDSLCGFVITVV